ncbi:disease resistance-like protein CSA1 [Prunus yedoensis var. nudiflora]|uniref:Disease resistance-like protein CSA1 n=1 Tax=Prunus yedoensis var. nudiflora TaxID=2094558 RepID=A0A315B2R2_PRUYE|nr:disease resistance-like protein CSA1 [Prunus yedoensis var. nudiflora]
MVKEVPKSIENLVALRKLHLVECSIQEIPGGLFCLTSLQELDLSLTKIKSIPASVKQAAQLSRLCLNGCKSLKSLPEFPSLLQCLEAEACMSLRTVSSSSTALAQGWEKYIFSRGLHEKHIFSNCRRLDENSRSNILGDAQLRIMRMATASSKFKEDKIEQPSYDSDDSYDDFDVSSNTDFLGFALSLVVGNAPWDMKIRCKYNFKTSNGESHEVKHPFCNLRRGTMGFESIDSHEVFVWWYSNVFEEVVEGAQIPTAFYKLVTEVNVDFIVGSFIGNKLLPVEKCGICLLYGKDADMIKQRAL